MHTLCSYGLYTNTDWLLNNFFSKVVFKNTFCVCGGGGLGHLRALATDANALRARALTIITGVQTITRLITGALTALMATVELLISGERVC